MWRTVKTNVSELGNGVGGSLIGGVGAEWRIIFPAQPFSDWGRALPVKFASAPRGRKILIFSSFFLFFLSFGEVRELPSFFFKCVSSLVPHTTPQTG